MVARFYSQADYLKVLTGSPWLALGHYLTITKWRPNFKPSTMEVQSTLAWVRFPTLPLENFDSHSLLAIGNAIGKAVKVDSDTVDVTKGKYARVCVEINLNQPLVPNVLVWGRKQPVEYEGLTKICFKCGRYGHKLETCGKPPSDPVAPGPGGGTATPKVTQCTVDTPFGPWMLSAYERCRLQQLQTRMNWKSQLSAANRKLNAQLDKQASEHRRAVPKPGGTPPVVFGSSPTPRGAPGQLAPKRGVWATDGTAGPSSGSKFAVLADNDSEDV